MRYALELAYDGTPFCGWQNQPNGIAVQQLIEESLSKILREKIEIVGCGRTDAGVHAHQYFAHFDTEDEIAENLLYNINALVGKNVVIKKIKQVDDNWHARFDANLRTYQYFIHQSKNPFIENYSYLFTPMLDINLMNEAAQNLLGIHDFTSFEKKGSDNKNSLCNVSQAYFTQEEDKIIFRISANRFLRNMVRAITASLLMVGTQQITIEQWLYFFNNKINFPLKIVVPAKGLFLWKIEYSNLQQ